MLNVSNSTVCPSLNDSAAQFSELKYSTLTKPGVEASFWTVAVLAAFLNILVIVARCRTARHRTSPLSMLLINLATSDFLLATGKILYLITARIVASWCSETTVVSKSLCFAAYLLSNMSCSMTTLTSATIASFGFKEIVGCCCCSSGRNSKRQAQLDALIFCDRVAIRCCSRAWKQITSCSYLKKLDRRALLFLCGTYVRLF